MIYSCAQKNPEQTLQMNDWCKTSENQQNEQFWPSAVRQSKIVKHQTL